MTLSLATISRLSRRQSSSIRQLLHRTAISANNAGGGGSSQSMTMMFQFQSTRNLNSESCYTTSSSTSLSIIDANSYLRFNTLHELVANATLAYGNNPLFGTYVGGAATKPTTNIISGKPRDDDSGSDNASAFQWMTYTAFGKSVALCRIVLKQLGVRPYSKVGIISNNRREWATIAAAAYSINASLVPMYEAQLPKDWTHILNDSECCVLFCSTEDIYLKAKKEVLPCTPLVREVLCLNAPSGEPHSFAGAMANAEKDFVAMDSGVVEPLEEDLANLIYTSGTTGNPKGVELIHSNQVSNLKAARESGTHPLDFPSLRDRSLSFLPWAHSYGQTCELWCLMSQGASMGICRGIPHILDDLQLVKPTLLFSVPTLYKKVHDGVINAMQNVSPIQRTLMRSALRLGKVHAAHRNGIIDENGMLAPPLGLIDSLKYKFLDGIVLSKIRNRFGGNLRAGFVAGAACPKEVINFMDAVGIPVCEGYGLTETSPAIAINVLSRRKVGSVGRALNGVRCWIVDPEGKPLGPGQEGEICCSGPNVMKGYHNNPDATNEVITLAPDRKSKMFHTGDLGKLDSDGFLFVTGRLKDLYKLENGKYVCPTPIEEAIGMSRFISQVVVCGANRPYNVALVVPDWVAINSEFGISNDAPKEELVNSERVKGLISAEIKLNCYNIKKFEIPLAFAFVAPFTADMVTPKMSIRRHVVMKAYDDIISDLYATHDSTGASIGDRKAA